jgi:leucyl-tRNA synthetase
MLVLLYPMVPHFSAEMWDLLGFEASPENQSWPEYDEEKAREEELVIVLQVNGKVRSKIQVAADIDDAHLQEQALADDKLRRFIGDKPLKKVIVVKKKLVNIVV